MRMAAKPAALKAVWIIDKNLCNQIIKYFIEETGANTFKPPESTYGGQEIVFINHHALIRDGKYDLKDLHGLIDYSGLEMLVVLFDPNESKNREIIDTLKGEGFLEMEINQNNYTNYALGFVDEYKRRHGEADQFGFGTAAPPEPKRDELKPVKKFAEGFVLVTEIPDIPESIESVFGTKIYDYESNKGWDSYNNQPLILVNKFDEIKKKSEVFSVNRNPPEGNTDKTTVVAISKKRVGVPEGVTAYEFELEKGDYTQYAKFFAELGNRIARPEHVVIRNKKKEDKPAERDDKGPKAFRRRKRRDEE